MKEAVYNVFASLVRTLVPAIVGAALSLWAQTGIALDPEFEAALTLLLGLAFMGLYYLAVRLLETYVWPKFGWLLGLARTPIAYTPETPALVDARTTNEITTLAADAAYEAKHAKS